MLDKINNKQSDKNESCSSSFPRLLVMNHYPFTEQMPGRLITMLFKDWPKECLAQLYHNNEVPSSYITCTNYFRLTDEDILTAKKTRATAKGKIFTEENQESQREVRYHLQKNYETVQGWRYFAKKVMSGKNIIARVITSLLKLLLALYSKSGFGMLVHETAWRKSRWLSPNLMQWLDEYKPQALFFYSGHCTYHHKIAHWVLRRYNIPLYVYIWDDYTWCTNIISPIAWINYFRYMKWFEKSLRISRKFYTISPAMLDEYSKRFMHSDVSVLHNAICTSENVTGELFSRKPLRLIFTGLLHSSRWEVIDFLSDCLLELHKQGLIATLDIYSYRNEEVIQEKLNKPPVSSYKGSLSTEESQKELSNSNVLVHVESFARRNVKATRLSIATKISDYLASSRMILAIGPEEVGSMRYLRESGAALCINTMDKDVVVAELKEKLFSIDFRKQMARNGRKIAEKNHDMDKIQANLYKDLCDLTLRNIAER